MTEAPELVIEFDRLRAEGPLDHRHELLNIQADLRIAVGGREWFSQPMFPVVELAAAADRWLSRGGDFVFESMEAEESPFLWVRDVAVAAWSARPGRCSRSGDRSRASRSARRGRSLSTRLWRKCGYGLV